jgi:hypothetical protein
MGLRSRSLVLRHHKQLTFIGIVLFMGLAAVALSKDNSQKLWYCWNSGNTRPHHLYVPEPDGEHLCSAEELHTSPH